MISNPNFIYVAFLGIKGFDFFGGISNRNGCVVELYWFEVPTTECFGLLMVLPSSVE